MKLNKYTFKIKHDNGIVNISVFATSQQSALNMVLNAENCPETSIIGVKCEDVK